MVTLLEYVRLVALLQTIAQLVLVVLLLEVAQFFRCDKFSFKGPRLCLSPLETLPHALLLLLFFWMIIDFLRLNSDEGLVDRRLLSLLLCSELV